MVLDYSKWDALELSDDSDFEPHPNVDKRSFIRAKQNQIHQQRFERRHQIETLKYERIINDGLLRRIDSLLAALRSHEATARDPNEFLMQALIESAGDPDEDQAPPPPEGVHSQTGEKPRYSQMMASLVDQVKKEVDESKTENWHRAYVKGIEGHKKKVGELQKELHQKLAELEKEESRKITSDSIHTGFNVSSVSKDKEAKTSTKEKPKPKAVELLNPGASSKGQLQRHDSAQSSGADADISDEEADLADDEHIEPTQLGKEFAKIPIGDYKACLNYIYTHRAVVAERETDGLLVEGFNAQMDGNAAYAKQCVHQALLLQYCRSLGKDGVGLFFKRISTPTHQARQVFLDDVNTTYARIRTRVAELQQERASKPPDAGVEQIQLHAIDPDTNISISIPSPTDTGARAIFDAFPPGLQRALQSGSLDRVNEVLGKMSVEEAEEVVEGLGEGGMLSLERGVVDGTTEEGREVLRGLEGRAKREGEEGGVDEEGKGEIEVAGPD